IRAPGQPWRARSAHHRSVVQERRLAGLEVVTAEAGGEQDNEGMVEFIARFNIQDTPQQHHERARFKRHNKKWLYLDGEEIKPQPIRRTAPRVGRNDPCPCGSGKKFKKCYPDCPNPFPPEYAP